jgi:DNA-binding protein H-NS
MTQNAGESAVIKNLQQEIERQKGLIQARDKKMEQLQEEQKADKIEVGKLKE